MHIPDNTFGFTAIVKFKILTISIIRVTISETDRGKSSRLNKAYFFFTSFPSFSAGIHVLQWKERCFASAHSSKPLHI